jgi:hypothetical protein
VSRLKLATALHDAKRARYQKRWCANPLWVFSPCEVELGHAADHGHKAINKKKTRDARTTRVFQSQFFAAAFAAWLLCDDLSVSDYQLSTINYQP